MSQGTVFKETEYEDITPYENFISAIRGSETKQKYQGQLEMFLDSNYDWSITSVKRRRLPEQEFAVLVNEFVYLIKKDPNAGRNKIRRYVMKIKKEVEEKKLNANTSRNRIKSIKTMLRANDVDFSWFLIDKMMPKGTKSEDRAYTIKEIQSMMLHCNDIVDKVIITMFSSSGFRLESWDYFTWSDVIPFRNEDGSYKGGALRIYHGDAEEYWTHTTPETCKLLDEYRAYWTNKFGSSPLLSDPLLVQERRLFPIRLKSKGVRRRVANIVSKIGIRATMVPGKNRYEVKLDHGFRKFFNTMLRRAKVYWADKEDMMGHKVGLEESYERYEESDFERFAEYQKSIPFLTISEEERAVFALKQKEIELKEEKTVKRQLEKKVDVIKTLEEKVNNLENFKEEMKQEFQDMIKGLPGKKQG